MGMPGYLTFLVRYGTWRGRGLHDLSLEEPDHLNQVLNSFLPKQ